MFEKQNATVSNLQQVMAQFWHWIFTDIRNLDIERERESLQNRVKWKSWVSYWKKT